MKIQEQKAVKTEAIKRFCRFIDNHSGEMIIRNGLIYDNNNNLIFKFEIL